MFKDWINVKSKKKTKLKSVVSKELKNQTILITGGAGSIGTNLTKKFLEFPVKVVRVFDINEHGLFQLGRSIKDKRLRLLLGNILDEERLELAGDGVDIVVHAAAIKNLEISEYNPIETIDTNVNGTVNLIKMVMKTKPKKFLNISTDKAADPTTLYGTTKQLSERLITWAGIHLPKTKFATVRFGNVFESRGNVFEVWEEERKNNKPISITDPAMKRYFFHINDATNFILECLPLVKAGYIFVPKMKKYSVKELASRVSKKQKIIGKRHGEKLSECLVSDDERKRAIEKTNMLIIPSNY